MHDSEDASGEGGFNHESDVLEVYGLAVHQVVSSSG